MSRFGHHTPTTCVMIWSTHKKQPCHNLITTPHHPCHDSVTTNQPPCHDVVTTPQHLCHDLVTTPQHLCHDLVTTKPTPVSRFGHNIPTTCVTIWSPHKKQPCHNLITTPHHPCHDLVTTNQPPCHDVVTTPHHRCHYLATTPPTPMSICGHHTTPPVSRFCHHTSNAHVTIWLPYPQHCITFQLTQKHDQQMPVLWCVSLMVRQCGGVSVKKCWCDATLI